MDPQNKPAWLTTEFWLTLIPSILFIIKALTGKDTTGIDINSLALLAVAVMTGAYAISRAITKRGAQIAQAMVTNQKLAIANDQEGQANARQHEHTLQAMRYANTSELEARVSALEVLVPTTKDKPRKVVKRAPARKATTRSRR